MSCCLNINLSKYGIGRTYYRHGKECIFDIIREVLIVKTPEEVIRQKFVRYLIDELNVPKEKIEVEVPMCYFKKGAIGRADIIVYGENDENINIPIILIECKAPDVPLTDNVWHQAYKYEKVLESGLVVITNGNETFATSWNRDSNDYCLIREIPKYKDIIDKCNLKFISNRRKIWTRPEFGKIDNQKIINKFFDLGWIGEGTDKELYPLIINLAGFLQDESIRIGPISMNGVNIVEDGYRYTSFGNAAGGSWTGDYRYFVLKDDNGNNQIISISILGALKCSNHPKFGNRKGHTTLVVAIDDFDKSHNSLQLNLDKYTTNRGNKKYTIWHDGTLTIGKSGAAKKKEVINYIKKKQPYMINENDKIILGSFDCKEEINWNQRSTKQFIINIIKYAILRDEFRRMKL